jgi:integral membrane protein
MYLYIKTRMVKTFKIIAILEGLSYLILIFVCLPLKYTGVSEIPVKVGGYAHGVLFIAYCLLVFPVWKIKNWTFITALVVGLLSLVPFGTFYVDRKYLSDPKK